MRSLMTHKQIISILIILLLHTHTFSKEISKKHSLDIYLKLGGLYLQNGHPANESYLKTYGNEVTKIIEGDIEYTFKPKKDMAAKLELEADNNRAGVIRIKEAWFQLPVRKYTTVKFGNLKKDLGFKGNRGSFKRSFFEKSLIYRYLTSFSILDFDIMLRTKIDHSIGNSDIRYIAALGADENQRVFINLAYSVSFKNNTLKISDLYANHVDTRLNKQNSNHLVIGYKHKSNNGYRSLEIFTGIDPDMTNMLDYLNEDRIVNYFGSELDVAQLFKFKEKKTKITKGLEPAIQLSWLSNDLENMKNGYFEIRGAFNVHINKPIQAKWHTSYGYVLQRSGISSEKWSEKNSSITSVVQIKW